MAIEEAQFLTMQSRLTLKEIQERNQLIVDLLSSTNDSEVHINDLAWFLQFDPHQADYWMRQHGLGKWMTGKNGHWWRGIL